VPAGWEALTVGRLIRREELKDSTLYLFELDKPIPTIGWTKQDIDEQVKTSVAAGAIVLTGGKRLDQRGNFYEPTVLVNVPLDSPASCEEIFGPVAMLFRVNDIDEAIELGNATSFGLGAAAWTNDVSEQKRFAEALEAGSVFLNGMVASDPRLPFGGIKNSGYGRELGEFGIREFVNIKAVWIR